MKCMKILAVLIMVVALATPAFADTIVGGHHNSIGGPVTNQGGAGGNATASSSATGIGVGIGQGGNAVANPVQNNTQVNTQVGIQTTDVTTVQGQQQGQKQQQGQVQGQQQGQGQGQKQQANNEGNHQSVNVDVPRQAPPAIPAALAVSSLTCYGSWSIAASTPFGGVGAGFPTKDEDCERARNALIFVNLGLKDVALALLGQNEDNAAAMKAAGVKYPGQAVAKVDTTIPDLKLNTPLGEEKKSEETESTNFGTRAHLSIPEALVANLAAQQVGAGM